MEHAKQAITGMIGIAVGLFAANVRNPGLPWIGTAVVALLGAYAFVVRYQRKHPPPPPQWVAVLRDQNVNLLASNDAMARLIHRLVADLLPPVTGAGGVTVEPPLIDASGQVLPPLVEHATGYVAAVKTEGNWQTVHQWGPDFGPTVDPSVIVAVRSLDGEKLRIARCEVTDPGGVTLTNEYLGSKPSVDPNNRLGSLEPRDFAATIYPALFANEPRSLVDGFYTVQWIASLDGISEFRWLTAGFTMQDGRLIQ